VRQSESYFFCLEKMKLPKDLVDLIMEYKWGFEHHEKFQHCLVGIRYYHILRRISNSILFGFAAVPFFLH